MSRVMCETGLVGADDAEAMDPRGLAAWYSADDDFSADAEGSAC